MKKNYGDACYFDDGSSAICNSYLGKQQCGGNGRLIRYTNHLRSALAERRSKGRC